MESPFAYLDPGSGSMIVQLIVGGLAAAGVALKLWWTKILRFLRIKSKDEPVKAKKAAPAKAAAPAASAPAATPADAPPAPAATTADAPPASAPEPDTAQR